MRKVNNRVFIFGSSGFIGSRLLNSLKINFNVVAVGRSAHTIFFDLETSLPKELMDIVKPRDTWVFLAGITSPAACESNFKQAFKVNVVKTKQLIDWLVKRGVKVIFVSSDTVFGNKGNIARDDDSLAPQGRYGSYKAAVETYFQHNSLVKIIRLSYVLSGEDKFATLARQASEADTTLDVYIGFERCVVLLQDVILGIKNLVVNWEDYKFQAANFCGPKLVGRDKLADIIKRKFFPNLKIKLREAPEDFWVGRVKRIQLDCDNFNIILGRPPSNAEQILGVF